MTMETPIEPIGFDLVQHLDSTDEAELDVSSMIMAMADVNDYGLVYVLHIYIYTYTYISSMAMALLDMIITYPY